MQIGHDAALPGKIPWGRYAVAACVAAVTACYIGAIIGGWLAESRRLDVNTILLLFLSASFVLITVNPSAIEGLSSITFGTFKAEFAQLQRQQDIQQRQVDSISAVLALLLTDEQQQQLLKLNRGETARYVGSHALRTRLRKLRDMRLLQMNKDDAGNIKTIAAMTDDLEVDLGAFLTLTELGKRIAAELLRVDHDITHAH
jgi:hypothetical protein